EDTFEKHKGWPEYRHSLALASVYAATEQRAARKLNNAVASYETIAGQPDAPRMEAVRLIQLALGDVKLAERTGPAILDEGYAGQSTAIFDVDLRKNKAERLTTSYFPTGDRELDIELARILGMLGEEAPNLLEKLAAKWGERSAFADDMHY